MKFRNVFSLLLILTFTSVNCQSDTINLYYDIGIFKLNRSNYDVLNNYIIALDTTYNYDISIISSADYLGSKKSNYTLAQNRAEQIKKFITLKSKRSLNSFHIINNGEIVQKNIKSATKGEFLHRKTSVVFHKLKLTDTIINTTINDSIAPKKYISEYNKIKLGENFILKNLIFEIGTDKLKNKSYSTLKRLAKFLIKNPNIDIEIGGHVCCDAEYRNPNATKIKKLKGSTLSAKRARFVYKYLYFQGIKKDRMDYFGYGFQVPIYYPEKNRKEMNANKRVEIKITKM